MEFPISFSLYPLIIDLIEIDLYDWNFFCLKSDLYSLKNLLQASDLCKTINKLIYRNKKW